MRIHYQCKCYFPTLKLKSNVIWVHICYHIIFNPKSIWPCINSIWPIFPQYSLWFIIKVSLYFLYATSLWLTTSGDVIKPEMNRKFYLKKEGQKYHIYVINICVLFVSNDMPSTILYLTVCQDINACSWFIVFIQKFMAFIQP